MPSRLLLNTRLAMAAWVPSGGTEPACTRIASKSRSPSLSRSASRAGGQVIAAGIGLSGSPSQLALAVAQQQQVLAIPSQPEVEVAIIVDVAQAGSDGSIGKLRSALEVPLSIVQKHDGAAQGSRAGQHDVLVAVAINIPDRNTRKVHFPAATISTNSGGRRS